MKWRGRTFHQLQKKTRPTHALGVHNRPAYFATIRQEHSIMEKVAEKEYK